MADTRPDWLRVSLREVRLTVERLLMLLGVPQGQRPAVRDLVLDAEAVGLQGLEWIDSCPRGEWRAPVRTTGTAGDPAVDLGGAPALLCAPPVLDLALALHDRHHTTVLDVVRVEEPRMLGALPAAAERYRARLDVFPTGRDSVRVRCLGPAETADGGRSAPLYGGGHLVRALHEGLPVDASLWWRLYHRSNEALTEDTPLSRGHAGALPGGATAPPTEGDPDYLVSDPR